MSKVHFFPPSLPDETLESRVTRYHYLSGNSKERQTFRDLFGSGPFSLARIVARLGDLAERLPGDRSSNISELLESNTIHPLYRPFLGVYKHSWDKQSLLRFCETYKARICFSCMQDDMDKHGCYYWHRAHHLPGVMVCWRHGEFLRHSCPTCTYPFNRLKTLLANPIDECMCGSIPMLSIGRELAPIAEKQYAEFARAMLHGDLPSTSQEVLSACYRRQADKMGYMSNVNYKNSELGEAIKEIYGLDCIARIDDKYANTKSQAWIRLAQTTMDMPISRHLLVVKYLFGSAVEFKNLLNEEIRSKVPKPYFPASAASFKYLRKMYRQKITYLFLCRPNTDREYLWANYCRETLWLTENDSLWLDEKLSFKSASDACKIESDPHDECYAELIRVGVEELYAVSAQKKRVNIANILNLLPEKIYINTEYKKARFPLVMQQISNQIESIWHFRLRGVIWALAEISRLRLKPSLGNFKKFSRIEPMHFHAIRDFFVWDLEEIVGQPINTAMLLKSTGVNRQWLGPLATIATNIDSLSLSEDM